MIEEEADIPKLIVHCILPDDLQKRKVCSKIVPKVLMREMKKQHLLKCQEFSECYEEFLHRVKTITVPEQRLTH